MFFKGWFNVVLNMFKAKCYECNDGKENNDCKVLMEHVFYYACRVLR